MIKAWELWMWGCQKKEHDLVEYTLDLVLKLIDPNPLLPFSISHEFHNNAHCAHQTGMSHWVYGFDGRNVLHSVWASLNHWDMKRRPLYCLFVITGLKSQTVILPVAGKILKLSVSWVPSWDWAAQCSLSSCLGADWWATEKWPHRLMVDRAPSLSPSWHWHTWPSTSLLLPHIISSTEYFIITPQ